MRYMILKLLENETRSSCDLRFFFSLGASLTRLRREPSVSIRKKYPLEPRVENVTWSTEIVRAIKDLLQAKCELSSNRDRRPQARGPRGSIEIAKCTILDKLRRPQRHKLGAGIREFARLLCGISVDGRSFCDFIWVLSELSKCFVSWKTMHARWKNEPVLYKHY